MLAISCRCILISCMLMCLYGSCAKNNSNNTTAQKNDTVRVTVSNTENLQETSLRPLFVCFLDKAITDENIVQNSFLQKKTGEKTTLEYKIDVVSKRVFLWPSDVLSVNSEYTITFFDVSTSFKTGSFSENNAPSFVWDKEAESLFLGNVENNFLTLHGIFDSENSYVSWGYAFLEWSNAESSVSLISIENNAWHVDVDISRVYAKEGNATITYVFSDKSGSMVHKTYDVVFDFNKPQKPSLQNTLSSVLNVKNIDLSIRSNPFFDVKIFVNEQENPLYHGVCDSQGLLQARIFLEENDQPYVVKIVSYDLHGNPSDPLVVSVFVEGYQCLSLENNFPHTQEHLAVPSEDDGFGNVKITYALQNNALVRDTFINGTPTKENTNWGAESYMSIGEYYTMLFYFNADVVPSCAHVLKAELVFYKDPDVLCGESCVYPQDIYLKPLNKDWLELYATWNQGKNSLLWSTPGARDDVLDGVYAPEGGWPYFVWSENKTYASVDVTYFLEQWKNNSFLNKGFVIYSHSQLSTQFCTTENSNTLLKPRLIFTLREPVQ